MCDMKCDFLYDQIVYVNVEFPYYPHVKPACSSASSMKCNFLNVRETTLPKLSTKKISSEVGKAVIAVKSLNETISA